MKQIILILILLCISSCLVPNEYKDKDINVVYTSTSGYIVEKVTIDSCEYLISSHDCIIHKANCKNKIHNQITK